MKTILVTGGAGFLGSNLCEKLIDNGDKVICMDNFYTGRKENIEHLFSNDNFSLIEHNIIEPILLEDENIDQIYNLACPASPPHYQKDKIFTFETSILGVSNMLKLANYHNARILQASTSEVYGDPKVHPQTESYKGSVNPIGIRACYDEGKRGAETLMFDYNRQHKTDIRVIRIFNTYGPKMDTKDGRVVSNFIIQALENKPITIYGAGDQTRSFCYVDDLLNGMFKLMNTEKFNGPVNVGNPTEFTIKQLAEKIISLTGSESKFVYKALPGDDPLQRKPNISLAKEKLNWEPTIALKDGLIKTIPYFRKELGL